MITNHGYSGVDNIDGYEYHAEKGILCQASRIVPGPRVTTLVQTPLLPPKPRHPSYEYHLQCRENPDWSNGVRHEFIDTLIFLINRKQPELQVFEKCCI